MASWYSITSCDKDLMNVADDHLLGRANYRCDNLN